MYRWHIWILKGYVGTPKIQTHSYLALCALINSFLTPFLKIVQKFILKEAHIIFWKIFLTEYLFTWSYPRLSFHSLPSSTQQNYGSQNKSPSLWTPGVLFWRVRWPCTSQSKPNPNSQWWKGRKRDYIHPMILPHSSSMQWTLHNVQQKEYLYHLQFPREYVI